MLTTAGVQAPVTPFAEVVGKMGTLAPLQIVSVGPKLNVGVIMRLTVTVKSVFDKHRPGIGSGVNVYTADV